VIRGREPDRDFISSQSADQAQMLYVGSQDVGLAIQRGLGGVGRADPAPVAQAHDLLGMLTTPDACWAPRVRAHIWQAGQLSRFYEDEATPPL
jgi:hypothetical protein